jgi:undecaprenyl diphosphate synthase
LRIQVLKLLTLRFRFIVLAYMIDRTGIPRHIAFIMDGNGRWARERRLPRALGHREGVKRVREITSACLDLGVQVVTYFAFSTENWNRPKPEVSVLMRYFDHFLKEEIQVLQKKNIRLLFIGKRSPLPEYLQKRMKQAQHDTRHNTGIIMVVALNYGSRSEILDAAKRFAAAVLKGEKRPDDLDEDLFSSFLYTAGLPDPDLLIRTSGEMRISNFLLWQLSYAEFYFAKKYWPDFSREDLEKAIREYQRRERRFGAVDVNKKNI